MLNIPDALDLSVESKMLGGSQLVNGVNLRTES
jgi:hypothetical protein